MRQSDTLCKPFRARFGFLVAIAAHVLVEQRAEGAVAYHKGANSNVAIHGVADRASNIEGDVLLTGTDSAGSVVDAPPEKEFGKEAAYLLEGNEKQASRKGKRKLERGSSLLSTIVTAGLSAALIVLLCLITWDVMNFVGDVPDPFEHVEDPRDIPAAIEQLLSRGESLAFVVRKCKYCGLGIRAMKNAEKTPVIIMVEGHRHQAAISDYLKSRYYVRGYPYFFLDRERRGHLSKIKQYLHAEGSTGMP